MVLGNQRAWRLQETFQLPPKLTADRVNQLGGGGAGKEKVYLKGQIVSGPKDPLLRGCVHPTLSSPEGELMLAHTGV